MKTKVQYLLYGLMTIAFLSLCCKTQDSSQKNRNNSEKKITSREGPATFAGLYNDYGQYIVSKKREAFFCDTLYYLRGHCPQGFDNFYLKHGNDLVVMAKNELFKDYFLRTKALIIWKNIDRKNVDCFLNLWLSGYSDRIFEEGRLADARIRKKSFRWKTEFTSDGIRCEFSVPERETLTISRFALTWPYRGSAVVLATLAMEEKIKLEKRDDIVH